MDKTCSTGLKFLLVFIFLFLNSLFLPVFALEKHVRERKEILPDEITKRISLFSPEELAKEGYTIWNSGNFNKYYRALSLFKKAEKLDHGNPEYLSAVGRLLFAMGRYDEAFEYLQYTLALNPQKAWVKAWTHICLGEVYEKRGDYSSALIQYNEALKLNTTVNSRQEASARKTLAEWKHRESTHFVFYYPEGGIAEKEIDNIVASCEKEYSFLSSYLNITLKDKIQWYLFPSVEKGREIMNEKPDFARPGVNQIYTVYSWELKEPPVIHLALVFSFHIGKSANLDPFFQWGFARYLAHKSKGMSFALAIMDLKDEGRFIPLSVLKRDFYSPSQEISFTESGSFVEFLINHYGLESFKKIWVEEDLNRALKYVYGKDFSELEKEWNNYIDGND